MPVPVYLWLYDDAGNQIKGSVNIVDRLHSIEVLGLHHMIDLPIDDKTGKITGTRNHHPLCFDKEVDMASPYIYQAITTGKTLKSAEFKYYRINEVGQEEHYFSMLLDNVVVVSNCSIIYDINDNYSESRNHLECIELRYEKLKWHFFDGNIIHSDSWNERATA